MARELERTEQQTDHAAEELANVVILNKAVHDQMRKEEEKCIAAEEALKVGIQFLLNWFLISKLNPLIKYIVIILALLPYTLPLPVSM